MPSLTLRNVPDSLLSRLKLLAERERRSLNGELLVLLEASAGAKGEGLPSIEPDSGRQAELWLELCGAWRDERGEAEIIAEIRSRRSEGREVDL